MTPPDAGADLRAAFVANCLRGALPPVDLRAVCLVRAIVNEGRAKDEWLEDLMGENCGWRIGDGFIKGKFLELDMNSTA